jgi:hypothetical protein
MAGRPRNFAALNVVHRAFWESFASHGVVPNFAALKDALGQAGLRPGDPRTLTRYVSQLREMGVLGPRDRPNFAPLYPAYLLVDLAPGAERALDDALVQHQGRVRRTASRRRRRGSAGSTDQLALFIEPTTRVAALAGGLHNTLVTTRGTRVQLDELVAACRRLGRVDLIRGLSQRTLRGIRLTGTAA